MSPERNGTILGIIVAAIVLAAAFIYVPVGSGKMAAKPTTLPTQTPVAAPATTPSGPRGPVVREVPD